MRRPLAFVLLCATTTLFLSGCTTTDERGADEIYMEPGNFYDPRTLTVEAGTTVTWLSRDSVPHTVTADDGSFESGYLSHGAKFRHTFDGPGTYTYHCIPHAIEKDGEWTGMVGTIVVTDAGHGGVDNSTA